MSITAVYLLVSGIISLLWLLAGSNAQTRIMAAVPTALIGATFGILISYGEVNTLLYWTTLIVTLICSGIFSAVSIAGVVTFTGSLVAKFFFHLFFRLGMPIVFIWTIVEMAT